MLKGFATVSYYADDVEKAEAWYSEILGIDAYYHVPGYTEFRVGALQHELGIIDSRFAPNASPRSPGGEIIYWHVDDLDASVDRLVERGATVYQPRTEFNDFVTASVVDPFGNILGIMSNPHFVDVLSSLQEDAARGLAEAERARADGRLPAPAGRVNSRL